MRLRSHLRPWLAALGLFAFAACNESSSGPDDGGDPSPIDISGLWTINVTIVEETGMCAGNNEPPWTAVISVDMTGNQVIASGDWHSNAETGPHDFTGTIQGSVVTWSGSYPEGIGVLTATYTLDVINNGNGMTGNERWTWTGPDGSCPNSRSTVIATRN